MQATTTQLRIPTNFNRPQSNATTMQLRIPVFPRCLPKTFKVLVEQHLECKLEELAHETKSHWPQNIRQSYSRRKYLFDYIDQKARHLRGGTRQIKLMEAAVAADTERGDLSLSKYSLQLKDIDPGAKHQKCN
jgi:hypothetical protein